MPEDTKPQQKHHHPPHLWNAPQHLDSQYILLFVLLYKIPNITEKCLHVEMSALVLKVNSTRLAVLCAEQLQSMNSDQSEVIHEFRSNWR